MFYGASPWDHWKFEDMIVAGRGEHGRRQVTPPQLAPSRPRIVGAALFSTAKRIHTDSSTVYVRARKFKDFAELVVLPIKAFATREREGHPFSTPTSKLNHVLLQKSSRFPSRSIPHSR